MTSAFVTRSLDQSSASNETRGKENYVHFDEKQRNYYGMMSMNLKHESEQRNEFLHNGYEWPRRKSLKEATRLNIYAQTPLHPTSSSLISILERLSTFDSSVFSPEHCTQNIVICHPRLYQQLHNERSRAFGIF